MSKRHVGKWDSIPLFFLCSLVFWCAINYLNAKVHVNILSEAAGKVGIYIITNKANNHVYVGQSKDIAKRWKHEIDAAFNLYASNTAMYNTRLAKAFRKYGQSKAGVKEAFCFEVLEECQISELDDKERFWISKLGCTYENSYNSTSGGQDAYSRRYVNACTVGEVERDLLAMMLTKESIKKKYGIGQEILDNINEGHNIYSSKELHFPLRGEDMRITKPPRITKQDFEHAILDLGLIRIKQLKSHFNCGSTTIQKLLNAYGLRETLNEARRQASMKRKEKKPRVVLYSSRSIVGTDKTSGQVVRAQNLKQACIMLMKEHGIYVSQPSHIIACCRGVRKSAYNYTWRWDDSPSA